MTRVRQKMMNKLAMTILEAQKKYSYIPLLDLEILIAQAIDKPKEFIFTYPEYQLSLWQHLRLRYFVHLRKKHYSIASIIGHKEFYGLDFLVNKKVLIPRPETELMVEEAIKEIYTCHAELDSASHGILKQVQDDITLIDVGTGSGCIPIAILKNIKEPVQNFAIDISRSALRMAKKNAQKHGVKINCLHGNLLQPILKSYKLPARTRQAGGQANNLIITANLPYLTEQQFQNEPSIQQEPKNALVPTLPRQSRASSIFRHRKIGIADKQGLALYEELLNQIKLLSTPHNLLILLEIDPSQTTQISSLIKEILPKANIEIQKDLAGLDRLVIIRS